MTRVPRLSYGSGGRASRLRAQPGLLAPTSAAAAIARGVPAWSGPARRRHDAEGQEEAEEEPAEPLPLPAPPRAARPVHGEARQDGLPRAAPGLEEGGGHPQVGPQRWQERCLLLQVPAPAAPRAAPTPAPGLGLGSPPSPSPSPPSLQDRKIREPVFGGGGAGQALCCIPLLRPRGGCLGWHPQASRRLVVCGPRCSQLGSARPRGNLPQDKVPQTHVLPPDLCTRLEEQVQVCCR